MNKKIWLVCAISMLGISIVVVYLYLMQPDRFVQEPIKVGILHSQTGTLGASEQQLINVVVMAIDEINARGGVLGRSIKPIIVDGKSDELVFEQAAYDLIHKEKVAVIFGCWTSASRKRVKTVVEEANALLFYPVQYEGLEESKNIIYTGAAPNQSIIPAVYWAFQNFGDRFFVIGSDYVFPRAAHEIIMLQAASLGAQVVGSAFVPLGAEDTQEAINAIVKAKPTIIFNAINGSTNNVFFKQLHATGMRIPVLSFSIAEPELAMLKNEFMIGHYAVWNYLQVIEREKNKQFIARLKKRYGQHAVASNNMESAYVNVYLWAQAVNAAKTTEVDTLLPYIKKQVVDGPGSIIYLDKVNNHAWREIFIGKIRFDKQFNIIWRSKNKIHPEPYPPFNTKDNWQRFLKQLYEGWGNQWARSS